MSVSARAGRRRQEGVEKVTGRTRFTADLELPELLHVQLVVSQLASAGIKGIDADAARSMPGVVEVVTAADLQAGDGAGPDRPLAAGRVFYVGQHVAAVVAETEIAAADAAAAVIVDYDETPPVVDPAAAMGDESSLVLDEDERASEEDASIHGASTAAEETGPARPRNVSAVIHMKNGDTDAAISTADVVIRSTYDIAGAHHSFMEPHVAVVRPEPDGGLTIWSPTQGPFIVRDEI